MNNNDLSFPVMLASTLAITLNENLPYHPDVTQVKLFLNCCGLVWVMGGAL